MLEKCSFVPYPLFLNIKYPEYFFSKLSIRLSRDTFATMLAEAIAVNNKDGILRMTALESKLDGLGIVDDFNLILKANLEATDVGLEGEALLGVSVSQPPILRLVPKKILESTGHSVLNGILLGIKSRVQQQLVKDFLDWCELNNI